MVAFGKGHLATEFSQVKGLELAVSLSVNTWNGATTLQLMLEDARVTGIQLYNLRAKNAALPASVPILDGEYIPDLTGEKSVVIAKVPENPADLRQIFQKHDFEAIYFKNEIVTPYYLDGHGTREQFAKLYKTIYQFPQFDVRYKLKELSHFLKIKESLLIKMIQIFAELGFVTITDGVMTVNKEAERREISESQIYQELKQTVIYQERMALATPQEIYEWLMKKDD